MHELSLAAELVAECQRRAAGRPVLCVRVRVTGAEEDGELAMAFDELAGEALGGARLEIEHLPPRLECSCGWSGVLDPASLSGHLALCPGCGAARSSPLVLELLTMQVEEVEVP